MFQEQEGKACDSTKICINSIRIHVSSHLRHFVFLSKKFLKMTWMSGTRQFTIFSILLQSLLLAGILTGCGSMNNIPGPVRPTAIQQFLMTQAVERSLDGQNTIPIPLTYGDTVILDSSGLTGETGFIKSAIGDWLGERGLQIAGDSQAAKYRIHVLVQALGLEQKNSLMGIPPIQSTIIPFALPEIALFKTQYQTGYARFRLDIFESATGKFLRSTPWFQGMTYFNEYTILFFFNFHSTDLTAPFW